MSLALSKETKLPAEHPLAGNENLIDQLCECGRLFHDRGWSVGTSSNYSAALKNDPVELILTASGKDKGRLQRGDFVHVGADGRPIEADQPASSAETMLHVVLAELPNVGSVLHTHSVWGTILSDYFFEAGQIELEGYEMLKGLEGIRTHETRHTVPIFDNTQDIATLASAVRGQLANPDFPLTHGFLMRNHGLYAWGKDIQAARRHIEVYEFLFECVGRKISLPAKNG